MRGRILSFVSVILISASLLCILYPAASKQINTLLCAQEISSLEKGAGDMDDEVKNEMLRDAQTYNRKLFTGVRKEIKDPSYEEILNVTQSGQMCAVIIPKINVRLPVYHGTDESVLDRGCAHMKGTSLPIGGENSHCCISGHTAYPGKVFFDDLVKLECGDHFYISVMGETHSYRVCDISVVEPDDTSKLTIQKNRDLVTLITCTPYAVNTHRLLVCGERDISDEAAIKTDENTNEHDVSNGYGIKEYIFALMSLLIILFIIIYTLIYISKAVIRRKDERHAE